MGEEGKTDADYAAENAERVRAENHHEVFANTIDTMLTENAAELRLEPRYAASTIVSRAREIADLAYPPPKAEGAAVTCPACGVGHSAMSSAAFSMLTFGRPK